MNLIDSATAKPPSQSLSLLFQPTDLKSECVDQVPAMPVAWKWYWECALINIAGWLLLFGMLFLLAYYMQDTASPFVER